MALKSAGPNLRLFPIPDSGRYNSAIPNFKGDGFSRRTNMLHYTLLFLVIALVAAWLGFGMTSGVAALAAKICFVAFLILFIASLVRGRGRTSV